LAAIAASLVGNSKTVNDTTNWNCSWNSTYATTMTYTSMLSFNLSKLCENAVFSSTSPRPMISL
jgi:hypothetical protein